MRQMIIMMSATAWTWTVLVGVAFGVRWVIGRMASNQRQADDAA
jgi:hypothetical protein